MYEHIFHMSMFSANGSILFDCDDDGGSNPASSSAEGRQKKGLRTNGARNSEPWLVIWVWVKWVKPFGVPRGTTGYQRACKWLD